MTTTIADIQRIFTTRLDTFGHLLDIAERHFPDSDAVMQARLADDMLPLAAQVAFACNQPRGFAQWCAGQPIENLKPESIRTLADARETLAATRAQVEAIVAGDDKLSEDKRIGLGPGRYCVLPGQQYVDEYLVPNLYFHVTAAYAILRMLGAPVGKSDYMWFLAPHVRREEPATA